MVSTLCGASIHKNQINKNKNKNNYSSFIYINSYSFLFLITIPTIYKTNNDKKIML